MIFRQQLANILMTFSLDNYIELNYLKDLQCLKDYYL